MERDRWRRLKEIYQSALDQPHEDRGAFLSEACGGDEELRREIESLIEQRRADGILDHPATGAKLGPYLVLEKIGGGGMGAVYKARDLRLDRVVALKILTTEFSRLLTREARAISGLNHRHICGLYDVGEQDGIGYLVMEFVEGETLASRLQRGTLPFEEVLRYGGQIAEALASAHSHGIVHHDLKPANVMLTDTGVKLLDFGLATSSVTDDKTGEGAIAGTLAYMAPERLEGKSGDARSDIFALGLILYEMASGRQPFRAESQAGLIAAVLRGEPAPIADVPASFAHVIRRCLERDPSRRWQSATDVGLELETASREQASRLPRETRLKWLAALCALLLLGGGTALWRMTPSFPPAALTRFRIEPPEGARFPDVYTVALSPDSRHLVYGAAVDGRRRALWLRSLDARDARPIPGTEGGVDPFWSPDGKTLAFAADGRLKRVSMDDGVPVDLCSFELPRDGAWSSKGVILIPGPTGLQRLPASGGILAEVTRVDVARQELSHTYPQFLPDGNHFLYFIASDNPASRGIYVGSLDQPRLRTRLLDTGNKAIYTKPQRGTGGALLWLRGKTLMAQAFDASRLQLTGEASAVGEDIAIGRFVGYSLASFYASTDLLVYHMGRASRSRLVWITRSGEQREEAAAEDSYQSIALAPNGQSIAYSRHYPDAWNLWLVEGTIKTRLTFTTPPAYDSAPVWSPDGRQIVFASNRSGVLQLYRKDVRSAGAEDQLTRGDYPKYPTDWSRDGRYILYIESSPATNWDLWALPLDGNRAAFPVLRTAFDEGWGTFSPDQKWIACHSRESGNLEAYVVEFTGKSEPNARKWRISSGGGTRPVWRGDGKEIFYFTPDGHPTRVMAVTVRHGPEGFAAGPPRELFSVPTIPSAAMRAWAAVPDGRRFLIVEPLQTAGIPPFDAVLNWRSMLKR